jgi:hypothetical protein
MRNAPGAASVVRCRSMSLKVQLDACRRECEANAEPHVVDAVRRAIQALASVQAPMRRRFHRPFGSSQSRSRRHQLFLGRLVPLCVLELKALATAHPEIERPGATLVALSPQARDNSSSRGRDGKPSFPMLSDSGCKVASRYRIAFAVPERFQAAYLALGYPQSGEDRIERLDAADTRHLRPR